MKRICIVRAKRTPQGRLLGALSKFKPEDLGVAAAKAALEGIDRSLVDMVVVGRVIPPDINVDRVISRRLEIPYEKTAFTVNMTCASGMKAVTLAADAIQLGQAELVLAGGVESMTNSPHVLDGARVGYKLRDAKVIDCLLVALSDTLLDEHMAITSERLSAQYDVDRAAQDEFAYRSHMKAVTAQKSGTLTDEITALPELDQDEQPRADTTIDQLARLRPVFKTDGTVTPGNASGINDGAAMLLLCDEQTASKHGWEPMCYLLDATQIGCDPAIMGIGPAHAFRQICQRSGATLNDFDTIEINEAFAGQTLACLRDLGLPDDEARLNPEGGAVALGQPVGSSGARLLVHLAHRVAHGESVRALAGLCVGGGMGITSIVPKKPT